MTPRTLPADHPLRPMLDDYAHEMLLLADAQHQRSDDGTRLARARCEVARASLDAKLAELVEDADDATRLYEAGCVLRKAWIECRPGSAEARDAMIGLRRILAQMDGPRAARRAPSEEPA